MKNENIDELAKCRLAEGKVDKSAKSISDIKIKGRQPFIVVADILAMLKRGGSISKNDTFANEAAQETLIRDSFLKYISYYGSVELMGIVINDMDSQDGAKAWSSASQNGQNAILELLMKHIDVDFAKDMFFVSFFNTTAKDMFFVSFFNTTAIEPSVGFMVDNLEIDLILEEANEKYYHSTKKEKHNQIVSSLASRGYFESLHRYLNRFDPYGVNQNVG